MMAEQDKIPKLNKQSSTLKTSFLQTPQEDNVPSFLLKTYQILENPKYQDIISWTKNGEGFIVKKIKEFSDTVLPIYFRHNNYTSFVRQLNMYDFHKTRQQNQQNAFKNFLFKKGHKYLLKEIQRKDYKKNKETSKQLYSIIDKQKTAGQNKEASCYSKLKEECVLEFPKDQRYKGNILQLKKARNQLEQKSLKLMNFDERNFNENMILKAIDVLFECSSAAKKAFYQTEILKMDVQLSERKRVVQSLRETKIEQQERKTQNKSLAQNLTNKKHTFSGFKQPLTEAKTVLFSSSQPKQKIFGQQNIPSTQISLFSSFQIN